MRSALGSLNRWLRVCSFSVYFYFVAMSALQSSQGLLIIFISAWPLLNYISGLTMLKLKGTKVLKNKMCFGIIDFC